MANKRFVDYLSTVDTDAALFEANKEADLEAFNDYLNELILAHLM